MRVNLKKYLNQKGYFRATVKDIKPDIRSKKNLHLLLDNVKDDVFNEYLTDHIWLKVGSRMLKHEDEICRGDVIKFQANVYMYEKTNNAGIDYGFKYPSKLIVININKNLFRETLVWKEDNQLKHINRGW